MSTVSKNVGIISSRLQKPGQTLVGGHGHMVLLDVPFDIIDWDTMKV